MDNDMEVSPALVVSGLSLIGSAASLYWSWQSRNEARFREIIDSISDMYASVTTQRDLFTVTQVKVDKLHLCCIDLPDSSDMKAPLLKRVEEQLEELKSTNKHLDDMTEVLQRARKLQADRASSRKLAKDLHELRADFRRIGDMVGNLLKQVDATAELIQVAEQRYRSPEK
jgi:DNA repair ATPase RecN